MRGYTVHLLFHLLAMVAGAGCGVAAGLWWFDHVPWGVWAAAGALAIGIVVLVLQGLYISASQPPPRRPVHGASRADLPAPPRRGGTRPDLPSATLVQKPARRTSVDQETRTAAADALDEEPTAHPPSRQPR
ncbi:hypothetical protein [Saccharopolyspora rosea]|uniref:Uncharacterized protein n=1 Tax=Saccharopolyspora rosea TaxID=524884 RepID=A0ABW3G0L7_9PSEU|nr:hypothetical protein [Saccharopolyspora rosea]